MQEHFLHHILLFMEENRCKVMTTTTYYYCYYCYYCCCCCCFCCCFVVGRPGTKRKLSPYILMYVRTYEGAMYVYTYPCAYVRMKVLRKK